MGWGGVGGAADSDPGSLPTVACLGAVEAVKVLAGLGDPLAGRLLRMDLRRMTFHTMNVGQRSDCPVCGQNAV